MPPGEDRPAQPDAAGERKEDLTGGDGEADRHERGEERDPCRIHSGSSSSPWIISRERRSAGGAVGGCPRAATWSECAARDGCVPGVHGGSRRHRPRFGLPHRLPASGDFARTPTANRVGGRHVGAPPCPSRVGGRRRILRPAPFTRATRSCPGPGRARAWSWSAQARAPVCRNRPPMPQARRPPATSAECCGLVRVPGAPPGRHPSRSATLCARRSCRPRPCSDWRGSS